MGQIDFHNLFAGFLIVVGLGGAFASVFYNGDTNGAFGIACGVAIGYGARMLNHRT